MSGGSHDYAYRAVEEFDATSHRATPLRRAFGKHLVKVAEAMRLIEWVDSCDNSPGDEDAAIRACISKSAEVEEAAALASLAAQQLAEVMNRYGKEFQR